MNTLRSAQRAYDNESPPEYPDYTENLTEAETRDLLILWMDFASRSARDEFAEFVNTRKARELSEMQP